MRIAWTETDDSEQQRVIRRLLRQVYRSIGRADRHLLEGRAALAARAIRQAVTWLAAVDRLGYESPENLTDLRRVAARAGVTIEGP